MDTKYECQGLLRVIRVEKLSISFARITLAVVDNQGQAQTLEFSVNVDQDIEGALESIETGITDEIFIHPVYISRDLNSGVDFSRGYPTVLYCNELVDALMYAVTAQRSA